MGFSRRRRLVVSRAVMARSVRRVSLRRRLLIHDDGYRHRRSSPRSSAAFCWNISGGTPSFDPRRDRHRRGAAVVFDLPETLPSRTPRASIARCRRQTSARFCSTPLYRLRARHRLPYRSVCSRTSPARQRPTSATSASRPRLQRVLCEQCCAAHHKRSSIASCCDVSYRTPIEIRRHRRTSEEASRY